MPDLTHVRTILWALGVVAATGALILGLQGAHYAAAGAMVGALALGLGGGLVGGRRG